MVFLRPGQIRMTRPRASGMAIEVLVGEGRRKREEGREKDDAEEDERARTGKKEGSSGVCGELDGTPEVVEDRAFLEGSEPALERPLDDDADLEGGPVLLAGPLVATGLVPGRPDGILARASPTKDAPAGDQRGSVLGASEGGTDECRKARSTANGV